MNDAEKYGVYCKMTCLGGSEKGTCACECPGDCELKEEPMFPTKRNEAIVRMKRFALNAALPPMGRKTGKEP